jgi:hypothetical protein
VVQHPGSFRDPSGAVFTRDGTLFREIQPSYEPHYRLLIDSGLYRRLADDGLLVRHEEVGIEHALSPSAARVLRPVPIPLITYPYEWCFTQLKRAALLVLSLERIAIDSGMTLKDATAYNVQFSATRPIWIDTSSFEAYQPGALWHPYLQFCRHFLAPLALMSYCDPRAAQLLRTCSDGIPLDLACSLLPMRSRLRAGLLLHLHLHARAESAAGIQRPDRARELSPRSRLGLIEGLRRTIESLAWSPRTEWSHYGDQDSYSEAGAGHKKQLVAELLTQAAPREVWDLGANDGTYSRIASDRGIRTFAWDADIGAVEIGYREAMRRDDPCFLPLVADLSNPSPALGWAHTERQSMKERCRADLVMALALTHHLTLRAGIPFSRIATFFAELAPWLIVEYIDRDDPKAAQMLTARGELRAYTRESFEHAFRAHFDVVRDAAIRDTSRHLYLMKRRG